MEQQYKEAWTKITQAKYILIITHINPDPDTITSALALSNLFESKKIKHKIYNNSKKLPSNLEFLNRFNKIVDTLPEFYDLVISVDCGDKDRFFFKNNTNHGFKDDTFLINIDHHISNRGFGDINIVDPDSGSTAELVYNLFSVNSLDISKECAQCLYAGIYTDTLGFTTNRVDRTTFKKISALVEAGAKPDKIAEHLLYKEPLSKYRLLPRVLDSLELHYSGKIATILLKNEWLKACGASAEEAESALNMVTQIGVVEIVVFLRQSSSKIRVSLRSKKDIDVSAFASQFNGGGHIRAAGCTVEVSDISEAKNIILEEIGKFYEF